MKHIIRRHTISFKNAYAGIKWAFSSQPNYTVHVLLSLLAIVGGLLFNISYNEWLTILTFIILGLTIETINTAIESATDCIDTHTREDIKIAKDVAAGAMLIFAIGSVVVAVIIFVPKLLLIIS
ncbi:MAG TPA: diacylglycerol kinase family protein [Patescibacteria group bacterium]|nr:diacylglycerol kinase family protein [Patescibacteria group bacterium]